MKPTPKSDKASPTRRRFEGVCNAGVFQIAPRTRPFPISAVNENTVLTMQAVMWVLVKLLTCPAPVSFMLLLGKVATTGFLQYAVLLSAYVVSN